MFKFLFKPFKNKKGIGMIDVTLYAVVGILVCYLILFVFVYGEHMTIQRSLDSIAEANLDAISENRQINSSMLQEFKNEAKDLNFYLVSPGKDFQFNYYQYVYKDGSFSKIKFSEKDISNGKLFNKGDVIRVEITYGFTEDEETPLSRLSKIIGTTDKTKYLAPLIGYAEGGVD